MRVFISHAAADANLARQISVALQKAGFDVWDPDSILPGDNWASKLGEALASSEAMVAVFSPEAGQSSQVISEVQYALTSGNYQGRLVPVLVGFPVYQAGKEVPWVLTKMNPVHVAHTDTDFSRIVDRLSELREASNAAN
jgi:hypothetical protein